MKKQLPVYSINKFHTADGNFYANFLKQHVREHDFTNSPHKHDFYLVALFTGGTGKHEVDFETYKVERGSLFLMKPGQMHYWELSKDFEGFVFFHSKNFYDEGFLNGSVKDLPFYNSFQVPPFLKLKNKPLLYLQRSMLELVEEYKKEEVLKWQKIHSLINLVYVELSREYAPAKKINNETYLVKVRKFEDLIEDNFRLLKFAKNYAAKINITEKHLNRITKSCLNKTSTQLITERVVLEAKRMLIHSKLNVTQIGEELGFNDGSYFNRFFKKNTSVTPMSFLNKYKRS